MMSGAAFSASNSEVGGLDFADTVEQRQSWSPTRRPARPAAPAQPKVVVAGSYVVGAVPEVGDINPADLAQAGSERERNRIIAQGGKRSVYDDPTRGWRSGYYAINWLNRGAFLNGNEPAAVWGTPEVGRGGMSARRGGNSHDVDAGDVADAVEEGLRQGGLDEWMARAILDGFAPLPNGRLEARGAAAVGFLPLIPVFAHAVTATIAARMVNQAMDNGNGNGNGNGAVKSPGLRVTVAPTEDSESFQDEPPAEVGTSGRGRGVPDVVEVSRFRGGFGDLIDSDGYRARL